MSDMIGHNNPPSAVDEIAAKYADFFDEAENWCDGTRVENDGQMTAVDDLIAKIKEAEKAALDAKEVEFRPHKKAADAVVATWKPFLSKAETYRKALLATVGDYKKAVARKAEAERQRLADEAAAKAREAEAAKRQADMASISAREEADRIAFEAREAERAAQAATKAKPSGLRKFWTYEITDGRALINHIARHDKPAMQAFIEEYARRQVQQGTRQLEGVKIYQDTRAI